MNTMNKYYAWLCVICLLGGGFIGFWYTQMTRPQLAKLAGLEQQQADKQSEHEAIVQASTDEAKARRRQELTEAVAKSKEFIVDYESASAMTLDISRIADDLELQDFSQSRNNDQLFSAINQCQTIGEGRIWVTFSGDFAQFAGFVNMLERNEPVVFVDKFIITKSPGKDTNDVDMVLACFVSPKGVELMSAGNEKTSE